MSLGLLGNVNIHEKLDIAYWMNVRLFNENVTKNRYVLSKSISKYIQNDILDCMLEICHEIIIEEIRTASYICAHTS
nr:unnamed protein product [Callosobruchus analis]